MDEPHHLPTEAERWELLHRHREQAVATVDRAIHNPAEAEDCVQEATIRLAARRDLDPLRVRSLLTRAALHIAVDHLRSRRARERAVVRLGGSAAAEVVSPEGLLAERHEADRAVRAIAELPRRERQVIRLRLAGYTVAETARLLGLSYKSVEGAYTRARARVRNKLGALLGWLADGLRRLGVPSGDLAAALALLFFVGPLLRHGDAGQAAPPLLVLTPSVDASVPLGPAHARSDGSTSAPPSGSDRGTGEAQGRRGQGGSSSPQPWTWYQSPGVVIPSPGHPGETPWLSWGGISVTGGDLGQIDVVGGVQRCLAQGGPSLDPRHGGCNT